MSTKTRILVTGSNRSGSTWVGQVLASHKKVDNIIEPLNLNRIKRYNIIEYPFWYPKINKLSPEKEAIKKLITYYLDVNYITFFKKLFTTYEGHNFLNSTKKRWRRAGKPIKMLKDPTALFSIPWLVEEFNILPIILIRHPAAYALSIKEKNWWFDFDNFLKQPNFFKEGLESLKKEVEDFKENENERDIIENASLLWKVFYTQVRNYQKLYPNWFYITHEELSLEPINNFKSMCDYLGLEFHEGMKNFIEESTQASEKKEFKRDAKKNVQKWKEKLTAQEKENIYKIVAPISNHFYKEWN